MLNILRIFNSKDSVVAYTDTTNDTVDAFNQTAIAAKEAVGTDSLDTAHEIVKTLFDIIF